MKPRTNDNPHPELQLWLKQALESGLRKWPDWAQPYIQDDVLLVPDFYVEHGRIRVLEWIKVRSREDMLKAVGYGPVWDDD